MLNPFGRLLSVDLSRSTITEQQIDPDLTRDYVGGSGLAARLLWDRLAPDLDPLGPDNPLLFITGPLTGTAGPTNGRFSVCARSPATGLWGEANCGGFWGPELRFAGYDAVLITGKAASPVYLWICDGMAELRGASHLWGQADTYQTQERIREEAGDRLARVACVGVAGERLIPYALILCDHGRVAGRAGMGAVMGSKNLKAIAVRGKGKLPIAQPQFFNTFRSTLNRALREENITLSLRAAGSASAAEYLQMLGEMPMRYFTAGQFEGQENVSGSVIADTILTGVTTCHACVIACGRLVTITEGPYTREKSKGPEYETMTGFGSILGSGDMNAATHLGQLCDVYGLDTISASNVIGLAYLLFDRGMLMERDTGGLKLAWGDPRPAEALLHLIAQREGIGEVMSRGAKALGAHFGVEELAAHVNNLEMPYHDPRALSGMGIVYATSPRGACHNQSDFFVAEIGADHEEIGIPLLTPPTPDAGKAALVARHQDYRSLSNSLIVCIFARLPVTSQLILYNAAVGLDRDIGEFMQAGARIWNLKRVINHRFGLTRANDKLPKLLREPLPDGPNAGRVPDFDLLMREYYAARGWDPVTGRPTRATLEALDLGFAADTLDRAGARPAPTTLQAPPSNLHPRTSSP
ncbi:MAG TPA: aldehyde ferredoxin oxidoreductase family protein [Anaerolineae bacterium]|nr:aldehyde ferredoxin oxidoreductase family protein [Anaerolineae bacterium]